MTEPTVEQCRREMRERAHLNYLREVCRAWEEYKKAIEFADLSTVYPENWGKHGVEAEIRYRYDADGKRIAVDA